MTSSRRELDEGRARSQQLGSADAMDPVPFGPWLQGRLVANRWRSAATTLEQSTSPDRHLGRWSCDRSYRRPRPEEPHARGHERGSRGPWVPFEWIATDEVRARWDEIEGVLGMFIAPSTPSRDTKGALEAIRHARERDVPLVGTQGSGVVAIRLLGR
jgi:hypothetical protein